MNVCTAKCTNHVSLQYRCIVLTILTPNSYTNSYINKETGLLYPVSLHVAAYVLFMRCLCVAYRF